MSIIELVWVSVFVAIITIALGGLVWVADDGIHTVQKFNSKGERQMEIGKRNQPSPKWGGEPFNR
ncbi:MAG: hypothetical protein IIA01_08145, partial [Proteobacteria bacterium]|nr:hypothetical protein [Pseudomonadota bacterium]